MNVEAAYSNETSQQTCNLASVITQRTHFLPVIIKISFPRVLISVSLAIKANSPISGSSLMVTGILKIREEHRSHKSR
jgi:hypothetical protein